MAANLHPSAPPYLPGFITAPGESDIFLNGAAVFLVVMALTLGIVYFRLHALPEHMAHKNANKLQFEVVAVLALLALFTHTNAFWIAALLLALVPIPDFHGPLATMADSLARMAGYRKQTPAVESSDSSTETVSPATTQTDEVTPPAGRQVFLVAPKQSESTSHDDDQSRGR
jgi:hypothetical protein